MQKNGYKSPKMSRSDPCLLLQLGMGVIYAALFGVYIDATSAPLHPAKVAQYGEMLELLLASLILLSAGVLVGVAACQKQL